MRTSSSRSEIFVERGGRLYHAKPHITSNVICKTVKTSNRACASLVTALVRQHACWCFEELCLNFGYRCVPLMEEVALTGQAMTLTCKDKVMLRNMQPVLWYTKYR